MTLETYAAFVAASILFVASPGPGVMMSIANGMHFGLGRTLACIAGTLTIHVGFLTLTALGMGAVLLASATLFTVLKLAGAAYLIFLGIKAWRAPIRSADAPRPTPKSLKSLYLQGLAVTGTNPKALMFYIALFPQFIDPAAPQALHFVILGAILLIVVGIGLSLYAGMAQRIAAWLKDARHQRLQNRVTGAIFIGAGVLLAGVRRA